MTSGSMLGYFSLLESEWLRKHGRSQLFNPPLSGMTGDTTMPELLHGRARFCVAIPSDLSGVET